MPSSNREWNKSQPPERRRLKTKYARAEFIPIKCQHPSGMKGTLAVIEKFTLHDHHRRWRIQVAESGPRQLHHHCLHESYGEQTRK